jgi:2-amino-4-hydroxy-6-hydroxymethyldihydropteridine diphosphokinase
MGNPNPIDDPSEWAYIALGSNLGNPQQIIEHAIQRLSGLSARPVLVSSLWRTTPVDCPPDSPLFINAVIALKPPPGETPETLFATLQKLEKEFGRKPKTVMNEARILDLDLIAFGKEIRATPGLTLPHPRAYQRRFVLQPLSEIAPNLILPGQTKTVAELLAGLAPDPEISKLGISKLGT